MCIRDRRDTSSWLPAGGSELTLGEVLTKKAVACGVETRAGDATDDGLQRGSAEASEIVEVSIKKAVACVAGVNVDAAVDVVASGD